MQCPHCGYFMSPLDKECLRCRQNGYVAPPSVVPPIGPNAAYAPPPQPNYAQPASVAPAPLPFDLPQVGMPAPAPVAPPSAYPSAYPSVQPLDLSQGYAAPQPTAPVYTPPQPAPPVYGAPPAPPSGPGYRAPNSAPYNHAASAAGSSRSSGWNSGQVFGGAFGSIGVVILVCLRLWYYYDRAEQRRRSDADWNAHYNATIGRQINNSAAMVEQSRQNAANFTPPPRYTVPQNMPSATNSQNSAFQQMQESQQRMQQMQQANQQRMQEMQQANQQRMQEMQQRMQQHRPGF